MRFKLQNGDQMWRQICGWALFLVSFLSLPLTLTLALCLVILRFLLTQYKNRFLPDYGQLLSGINNMHSLEWPYDEKRPVLATTLLVLYVHSQASLEDWQSLMEEKLKMFQEQNPVWFPEMREYLTTLCGFSVWRKEKHFNVRDHFKMLHQFDPKYRDLEITDDNISKLCYDLSKVRFPTNTSPWEMLLHNKVNLKSEGQRLADEGSVILCRFHHTLSAGLSIVKVLCCISDDERAFDRSVEKYMKVVPATDGHFLRKLGNVLLFPTLGGYQLAQHFFQIWDNNHFHEMWKPKFRRNFMYCNLKPVTLDQVRRIRKVHGEVKTFPVLLAALTGALRKYMVAHDIPLDKAIHASVPLPIPSKHRCLGNDSIVPCVLKMPVNLNDRHKILESIERDGNSLKSSRIPASFLISTWFLGLFPQKLVMGDWRFTTALVSNVPAHDEQITTCGGKYKLSVHSAFSAMPMATIGIYLFIVGQNKRFTLSLGMSDDVVPSESHLKEIRKYAEEEFEHMQITNDNLITYNA